MFSLFQKPIFKQDYNCEDYSEDYGDIQYYLDKYAEWYGCGLELCGLTAEAEHDATTTAAGAATTTAGAEQGATTTAPLLLTLLFGLFK